MASLRNLNQSGPFWDFVNNFDNNFDFDVPADSSSGRRPWGGPQSQRDRRRGPPPPFATQDGPPPFDAKTSPLPNDAEMPFRGPPPPGAPNGSAPPLRTPEGSDDEQGTGPEHRRRGSRGPHGHHGRARGGPRSGRGRHGGPGAGYPGFGWGHHGWAGPPPPMGEGWNMNNFASFFPDAQRFMANFLNRDDPTTSSKKQGDFVPSVDVFDTEASYVVHVSLAGAKKEDIAVNWEAESSLLNITGIIHRPGDEDLLKTLALDERKIGPFERKVRLGSRSNPAQIDIDRISAKLEDGVLKIDVPKEDKDFVEIKKVDVQ
ncbi:MAG: hypothetical protein M1828_001611 [Chrysothrix sp. TS-e1954]|nr:MAG: hypothetical protein M1828_001611 [Chrysothrix sp. TS-e1954]